MQRFHAKRHCMTAKPLPLLLFAGRAGDRNARAIPGAAMLADALAKASQRLVERIGTPAEPLGVRYDVELQAALADLRLLHEATAKALATAPLLACLPRCAAALATLPAVAQARPDACVVWFDAHADSNVPEHSTSGYLGGLVLTGATGLWHTGLGSGLSLSQVVLVGSRDLDPFERALVDNGALALVTPGLGLASRLRAAIRSRPCYVHVDCDVLDVGLVPTEYQVPGGLTFNDLHDACTVVSEQEVVGVEVAEFEATWPDGSPGDCADVVEALSPLLQRLNAQGSSASQ
jgi:arginase